MILTAYSEEDFKTKIEFIKENNYFITFPDEVPEFDVEDLFPENQRNRYKSLEFRRVSLKKIKNSPF